MQADTTQRYWHFLECSRRLRYGEPVEVFVGQTLTATGRLAICRNGMHASRRAIDAIRYAPGPVACRVCLSGEIVVEEDKVCARSRTVLWMADASAVLRDFIVSCGEWLLTQEHTPDPRSLAAVDTARAYLRGIASRDEFDAAVVEARLASEDLYQAYRDAVAADIAFYTNTTIYSSARAYADYAYAAAALACASGMDHIDVDIGGISSAVAAAVNAVGAEAYAAVFAPTDRVASSTNCEDAAASSFAVRTRARAFLDDMLADLLLRLAPPAYQDDPADPDLVDVP